jgi:DNA polymerase-3 subunit delta
MAGGALSYSAAARLIDKGKLPLCLFLYGPEDFLKEELVRRAADSLVAPGLRSFNLSAFDLAEASIADALAAAEAFPAMGGARMVVVRNGDRLKRGKKDLEILRNKLSNPGPYLCFVLVAADPDPTSTFLKSLPHTLTPVALKSPSEGEMDAWLSDRAQSRGLLIGPRSRRLLMALAGRSMWRVSNELEKLCINAADRKEIAEEDVLALFGGPADRSPFALANAVAKGQRAEAASVVAELIDSGEEPVAIAGLLAWNLVRTWSSAAGRLPAGAALVRGCRHSAVVLCEVDHALKRGKLDRALAAQLMVDALTTAGE